MVTQTERKWERSIHRHKETHPRINSSPSSSTCKHIDTHRHTCTSTWQAGHMVAQEERTQSAFNVTCSSHELLINKNPWLKFSLLSGSFAFVRSVLACSCPNWLVDWAAGDARGSKKKIKQSTWWQWHKVACKFDCTLSLLRNFPCHSFYPKTHTHTFTSGSHPSAFGFHVQVQVM